MQPILHTSRLLLRPCTPGDVETLHAHWTTPEVRQYLWDNRIIERDTVQVFVQASLASSQQHRYGLWVVTHKADGAFCGVCGLRDGPAEGPELLYSLAPHHWGSSLGTESARGVLRYAFHVLHLPRIIATVDKPNVRSIRVLEHLGFLPTDERLVHGNPVVYYAVTLAGLRDVPDPGGATS